MRRVSRFNLTHCGGLRGLAVLLGIVGAMSALSTAGKLVSSAEALQESKGPTERTEGEVVGASISHPNKWFVERETYTYDQTYGFTLWRPDSGALHETTAGRQRCASRWPTVFGQDRSRRRSWRSSVPTPTSP